MGFVYDDPTNGGQPAAGGPRRRIRLPGQTWQQLIEADPRYQAHKTALAGQSATGAASRQAAVRAALIHMGMTAGLKDALSKLGLNNADYGKWLGEDVNDQVFNEAQGNEFSTTALEDKAHGENLTALQDVLAAKGILHSGQTGYETGQENFRHEGAQAQAVQDLLGYLSGQYGDFAGAESGRATDLGDYAGTVENDLKDEGATPAGSPGEAVYDPEAGAFFLNGKYYDESGKEVDPAQLARPDQPPPGPVWDPGGSWQSIAARRASRRFRRRY
jgi:hypothetical protein